MYILYTARHTAVSTIKESDRDLYLDLLEAMCSERVAIEIANKASVGKVKTPEYEIDLTQKITFWRNHAKEMRQRFIEKCQAGYAGGSRT